MDINIFLCYFFPTRQHIGARQLPVSSASSIRNPFPEIYSLNSRLLHRWYVWNPAIRKIPRRNLAPRLVPHTNVGAMRSPPGFSTRRISLKALSGSGMICSAFAITTASKLSGA